MESRGLRLTAADWNRIDRLAEADKRSASAWLRIQVEALLSRIPDMPDTQENMRARHQTVEVS